MVAGASERTGTAALSSTEAGADGLTPLDGFAGAGALARGASIGKRVNASVLLAPGAVIGRCGRGVPHIPQNRLTAGFSDPQLEQTKLPPGGFLNPKLCKLSQEMDESTSAEVAQVPRCNNSRRHHLCGLKRETHRYPLQPIACAADSYGRSIGQGGLMGPNRAFVQAYQPGETVPKSGIYRVRHHGHHHDHEVTCISGEQFPECNGCRRAVRFSLIIAAHAIDRHMHFAGSVSHDFQEESLPQGA
jgi:hypothetical protein